MEPFSSRQAIRIRPHQRQPRHAAPDAEPVFLMHITVATARLGELRQLVVQTCGAALSFMRIEAVDHAERMQVWLCLPETALRQTMDAVMRRLPAAEFGRIRPAP